MMYDVKRIFSDALIFSMSFPGQPESSPGSTRVTIDVEITIFVLDTEALRVLFRALRAFSEWNCIE